MPPRVWRGIAFVCLMPGDSFYLILILGFLWLSLWGWVNDL
jgi:hypothetical protein